MLFTIPTLAAAVMLPVSPVQAPPTRTEVTRIELSSAPFDGRRQCAAYDLHVLWLIEEHGAAEEIAGDEIAGAAHRLHDARTMCATGQVVEALEVYSTIALVSPKSRWFR